MKFRILVLRTAKTFKFSKSRFQVVPRHPIIVNGINDFFKKLKFGLRRGMLCKFVVKHNVHLTGIKFKKY